MTHTYLVAFVVAVAAAKDGLDGGRARHGCAASLLGLFRQHQAVPVEHRGVCCRRLWTASSSTILLGAAHYFSHSVQAKNKIHNPNPTYLKSSRRKTPLLRGRSRCAASPAPPRPATGGTAKTPRPTPVSDRAGEWLRAGRALATSLPSAATDVAATVARRTRPDGGGGTGPA